MSRLASCSRCGKIHPIGQCPLPRPRRYTDAPTDQSKFRSSYKWTQKSEKIRKRDHYLCQACLHNLDGLGVRYTTTDLEVHHIEPLADDYDRRLDDSNLITLCREHHEQAEQGVIGRVMLHQLTTCSAEERATSNPPGL